MFTEPGECDGFPFQSALYIGPYGVLSFSQGSKEHLLRQWVTIPSTAAWRSEAIHNYYSLRPDYWR